MFHMKQKRKKSAQELLASLRGQQADNISTTFQDSQQQFNGDRLDEQLENENIITPTVTILKLSSNEANTQEKEEPLVVKVKDTSTGEITTQKMQPDRENFEFDYAVGIKWVMHSLRERWRAYKYKLRCEHFYPNKSKEEILANPPANMDSNDWTAFVHYYKEDKMKAQSAQNARNRRKLKVSHAGGSKSNARRGCQMEQKLGRPVCRSEVVLSTLLKKNGNYVNEEGKF